MAASANPPSQANPLQPADQYDNLATATSTRILHIYAFDKEELVIYGTLEQVDLERSLARYIALSYTWGPAIDERFHSEASQSHPCKPCKLVLLSNSTIPAQHAGIKISSLRQFALLESCGCVKLGQNLSDFFFHHHLSFTTKTVPLWIDAICINQENKQEVSNQILLMGDIYSKASNVVVWLGDDSKDLDMVMWFLKNVRQQVYRLMHMSAALRIPQEEFEATLSRYDPLDAEFWKDVMHLNPPDDNSWAECFVSFYRFFSRRRWFKRAWILQEAVLAKSVRFVCHMSFFEFDDLMDLDYHFTITSWNQRLFMDPRALKFASDMGAIKKKGELYTISHLRMRLAQRPQIEPTSDSDALSWGFEFGRLLHLAHQQEAMVDQDYVYCVLGMAQRFLPPGKPSPFHVDLNDSAADVFARSCELIIQDGGLSIVSYVGDRAEIKTPNIPSWAVDWAARTGQSRIGSRDVFFATKRFPSSLHPSPRVEERRLIVSGAKVAIVAKIFAPFLSRAKIGGDPLVPDWAKVHDEIAKPLGREEDADTAKVLLSLVEEFGLLYRDSELFEDALRRTMILDSVERGAAVHAASPNLFGKTFERFLRLAFWLAAANLDVQELKNTITRLTLSELEFSGGKSSMVLSVLKDTLLAAKTAGPSEHLVPLHGMEELDTAEFTVFTSLVARKAVSRRLFMTNSKFLGYGLASVQPGDEVWLLGTHNVPVVLRPQSLSGRYVFMGDAYVHGIMYGEHMTEEVLSGFRSIEIE